MNSWSEEDTTIVLAEYCRRGLGQIHHRDAHVIELGALIGRSPSAVVRKVGNLAHFDPTLRERNVRGLSHASKLDRLVWDKYNGKWDQLALDASTYLAARKKLPLEELFTVPPGAERKYLVKQRIHQDFFRQAVLSSYRWRCCITGLGHHSLLEACHIVGWNVDESQRTNPSNGLCMNVLFHRAYDKHLMRPLQNAELL